jgi:hypothetical protein
MTAIGPLERRARSHARYWLLQGMVAAGDALPQLIADAEALATGIATGIANGRAAGQPHDAQMALRVLRHAYETGQMLEPMA